MENSELDEKKHYDAPSIEELGDIAELTNYDVSVRVP
jgi:hypothetical protein